MYIKAMSNCLLKSEKNDSSYEDNIGRMIHK